MFGELARDEQVLHAAPVLVEDYTRPCPAPGAIDQLRHWLPGRTFARIWHAPPVAGGKQQALPLLARGSCGHLNCDAHRQLWRHGVPRGDGCLPPADSVARAGTRSPRSVSAQLRVKAQVAVEAALAQFHRAGDRRSGGGSCQPSSLQVIGLGDNFGSPRRALRRATTKLNSGPSLLRARGFA